MILSIALSLTLLQAPDTLRPVPRQDDWWQKRHAAAVSIAQKGDVDTLFIGDSITHGFGGEPYDNASGRDTWDFYYGDRKPLNLGFSGDRTQHVLWRLANGEMDGIQPKLIQIMIGTNNVNSDSADDIAKGVEAVCVAAHEKAPNAKELLLAIFPRDGATSPSRLKIGMINEMLQPWARSHGVTYLDIGQVFLDADGEIPKDIMPDRLHPNAYGYRKWAMEAEPTIARLLHQKPKTTDNPFISTEVPVTQNRQGKDYWLPRHQHVLEEIKQDPSAKVILIGDSITAFMGESGQPVFDRYLAKYNTINEGFGWDRTENVLWRIQQGELDGIHPSAIVILIGTNNLEVNTPGEIRAGVQSVLRLVQAKQPHAHILLLGLFPRGQQADDKLRVKAHKVNELLKEMPKPREVKYMEIWDTFLQPDGSISAATMSDYLHPTPLGYGLEMKAITPLLDRWVGGQSR